MRIIPKKTKVQVELFRGITLTDMLIGLIGAILVTFVFVSSLPLKWLFAAIIGGIFVFLLVRLDTEPNYIFVLHLLQYFGYPRRFDKVYSDSELLDIKERGEEAVYMEEVFEGGNDEEFQVESKAERKARLKAQKAERKADDKILKSKTATKEEKDAIWLKRANQSAENAKHRKAAKESKASWYEMSDIIAFTDIKEGFIEYGGVYYGAAIEVPPIEFRFFSKTRRNNSIESGLGAVLRAVNPDYCANIVKIERPVQYDHYKELEKEKLESLRKSYENGMLTEKELQTRVEIIYERITELNELIEDSKVVLPFYYVVLYDSDRNNLTNHVNTAMDYLRKAELEPKRLNDKELAVFLKYSNQLDFDERDIEKLEPEQYAKWAMPKTVEMRTNAVVTGGILTHNMRLVSYPTVVGDSWLAGVMSYPNTKVVIKCQPMDRAKSVSTLDRSLQELRSKYNSTNVDSELIELQTHIDTLQDLLATLSGDNETLLNVNIYVTAYDLTLSELDPKIKAPEESAHTRVNGLKKAVRRIYQEQSFKLNNMDFNQTKAFIGSQISAYDPMAKDGRGMPSNTLAATFPWIYSFVADEKGVKLGDTNGIPLFFDFFRRDSERVNSNMVIVGKSGSGKSYATKSLLTNLAADDAKIFILDPENEYTELADNLHGKFINVGNALYGRLNPFHIITALDDDESGEGTVSGAYATHLQFLEEFLKQIIPECDKDAMEYLNSLVDRTYSKKGITPETDLTALRPEDYPIFDDLYDNILLEFQSTDNEYIRTMLRTLMNYIAKFSTGGRNANIWNGPSSITTDENFTVFNFQSLLANRNSTIANGQMLLVMKYLDNEIIKNRDYNTKYGLNRKIVVVIDEAHVFIDTKYPIALDFMFQLAKRIRKYNGMQIVITQNIKDFVGSEEIARKSTAIINACQYSMIFSLAPNDMEDLCKLYEKAGGINEREQEEITQAPRGQAFTVMGPQTRTTFKVKVPDDVVRIFEEQHYQSVYFTEEENDEVWMSYLKDSRERRAEFEEAHQKAEEEAAQIKEEKHFVTLVETTDEELAAMEEVKTQARTSRQPSATDFQDFSSFASVEDFEIPDIPETPEGFLEDFLEEPKPEAEPEAETSETQEIPEEFLENFFEEEETSETQETQETPEDFFEEAETPEEPAPKPEPPAAKAPEPPARNVAETAEAVASRVSSRIIPMPQMPAPPQPTISASGAPAATTEQLLAELLSRFSYEAMMEEIRRTVKEELAQAGLNMQPAQMQPAQMQPAPPEPPAETPVEEEMAAAESLSEEETLPEMEAPAAEETAAIGRITPVQVPAEEAAAGAENDFDFDSLFDENAEDGGFDIMKLLEMEADKLDEISPIDDMITYGEEVTEITLEQLAAYIKNQSKAG